MEQTPESPQPPVPELSPDISFDNLHPPLARLLPPDLRHRSKGVNGSLKALETFFGADISHKMIDAAANLSERQMQEVNSTLRHALRDTDEAVSIADRPDEHLKVGRFHAIKSLFKSPEERRFEKLLFTRPEDHVFWPMRHIVTADEIGTHENLLPSVSGQCDAKFNLSSVAILKHLALYCQQTAIRDPLYTRPSYAYLQTLSPEEQKSALSLEAQRRRLANGIRQLLPIAPLLRSGAFILVNGDNDYESRPFIHYGRKYDPFLMWILGQHRPDLLRQITELLAVPSDSSIPYEDDVVRHAAREQLRKTEKGAWPVVRQNYPYDVSDGTWQRIVELSNWTYGYSLTSFTSDPVIVRHLEQGARIALNNQPSFPDVVQTIPTISPSSQAISYHVPPLHDTSFTNVARLRDSDTFEELRLAMVQLAKTCADGNPENYDAYQRLIGESAQDIIGPLHRKIEQRLLLGKLAKLGIAAGSKTIHMGISGVAGKAIEAGFKKAADKKLTRHQQVNEIARGILRSLLDYR